MATLTRGIKVEICPYRASGLTARKYQEYDGAQGYLMEFKNGGATARVNVISKNTDLAGGVDVPVRALRALEDE